MKNTQSALVGAVRRSHSIGDRLAETEPYAIAMGAVYQPDSYQQPESISYASAAANTFSFSGDELSSLKSSQ